MADKPALLVHPAIPTFEPMLAAYDVVHWPTERRDIRAAVTIGYAGISNAMMDALPELRCIVCFGVGVDGLDLAHCAKRGVTVTNGRDVNQDDVADLALGLLIACARKFTLGERLLREGKWTPPMPTPPQRRLKGMKLGIVGMGAIGREVAQRAAGFGLDIRWYGPRAKPDVAYPFEPGLVQLATWADALIVCARGDQTGLISADVIAALGDDGILVNVSRGGVVDEDALIAALKGGKLGAAGLDVFQTEPTPPARWADVPNCTLLPHIAGNTREALMDGVRNVLENLRRFHAGEDLLTPL